MSKIKVLLEDADKVRKRAELDTLKDCEELMDDMRENADWAVDTEDDGHESVYMSNYSDWCDAIAERYLVQAMEEEGVELSGFELDDLRVILSEELNASFLKYERTLAKEIEKGE